MESDRCAKQQVTWKGWIGIDSLFKEVQQMKLEGAVFKTLRKAQGSVTLEYLAEGSCGYKNIYMDSRKDPLGATKPQQNWESP